jgi:hypothetical protein
VHSEAVNGAIDLRHHSIHLAADFAKFREQIVRPNSKSRGFTLARVVEGRTTEQSLRAGTQGLLIDLRHGGTDCPFDRAAVEAGRWKSRATRWRLEHRLFSLVTLRGCLTGET